MTLSRLAHRLTAAGDALATSADTGTVLQPDETGILADLLREGGRELYAMVRRYDALAADMAEDMRREAWPARPLLPGVVSLAAYREGVGS